VKTPPGLPTFRGPTTPVFVNDEFEATSYTVNHLREFCVPTAID
jgi:hypothetical protein